MFYVVLCICIINIITMSIQSSAFNIAVLGSLSVIAGLLLQVIDKQQNK